MLHLDRQELSHRLNRLMYSRNVLVLLAVSGTLLTALVAGWLFRLQSHAADQRFLENVEERSRFLGRELDAGVEALYTLGEVIRFVDSLPALVYEDVADATLVRNPGLLALEWLPRIDADKRAAFESGQQRYYPGYRIFSLDDADAVGVPSDAVAFPVAYVAPFDGNTSVLGADFFSEPLRRRTLEQAWNSGHLSASAPLHLIQLGADQRGMLLVLPVFLGRPETVSERRQALRGFVVAAIDMRVLVDAIADPGADSTRYMAVTDITDKDNPALLFHRGTADRALLQSVTLPDIGGRVLQISMSPDADARRLEALFLPLVVAVAGGLMVLLVCGYLYLLQRRGEIISEQVRQQTRALREANFRLETLSVTDPLTGLSNRRAFDDYLEQEWQRASRDQTPLSILLVDVDHFKRINDEYGHPAGDACLRELSRRLQAHFKRPADRVVRFGGEEFAVVMPNTEENALAQAERFRAYMASERIQVSSGLDILVTISAGLATVVPGTGVVPRDLVKRADEALYHAKRNGRNRIHCYQPVSQTGS